jgi:MFS family permease
VLQSIVGVPTGAGHHHHHHHKSADNGATAVLLTAIPFAGAVAAGLWNGWHSHTTGERPFHVGIPYFISGLLFLTFPLAAHHSVVVAFVILTLVIIGVNSAGGVCTALASAVASGSSVAVSLAVYNAVANIGGVVGPWILGYMVQRTGSYTSAVQVLGLLLCASGLMACLMRQMTGHDGRGLEGKGHSSTSDDPELLPLKADE